MCWCSAVWHTRLSLVLRLLLWQPCAGNSGGSKAGRNGHQRLSAVSAAGQAVVPGLPQAHPAAVLRRQHERLRPALRQVADIAFTTCTSELCSTLGMDVQVVEQVALPCRLKELAVHMCLHAGACLAAATLMEVCTCARCHATRSAQPRASSP